MITASTQSAMLGCATTKPFTPIRPTRAVALSRSRRHVTKAQAQDEAKGPNKLALSLAGVFAATQLAMFPAAPPAEAFSLFPKTAVSQEARDKLNKKTDNLPSIQKTGEELVGGSDPIGAKNPKDLGKALDKATPDVDLTQNPKSLGKDVAKGAKNALPDVSAVPSQKEIIAAVPSPKDIQKKLESSSPLGALPSPQDLANKAKTSTPNADTLASKAKANLPKPPADLKSKIKSTPSATIGFAFEVADLQGQNNQSQNYPSPGKNYSPGKPNDNIGPLPDKITSPTDPSMFPNPKKVSSQTPGADAGISSIKDVDAPDLGKAAKKAGDAADSIPNPAEKAGNPLDSVKSLFGQ